MSPNPNPSSRIELPCWNMILLSRSLIHLRLEAADAIAIAFVGGVGEDSNKRKLGT